MTTITAEMIERKRAAKLIAIASLGFTILVALTASILAVAG
jgi:hypothetical protein